MEKFAIIVLLALVSSSQSKSLPDEDSVVSVYTTLPTTSGTNGLDVYQQIATNLAERISSPIYRLFGYGKNITEQPTTKKPWESYELLNEFEETDKKKNEIPGGGRDVEELSVEALNRPSKKPEKVTLYSSYLPILERFNVEENDTKTNEVQDSDIDDGEMKTFKDNSISKDNDTKTKDDFDDDDFDDLTFDDIGATERQGPFVLFLEWIGQFIQLAWGALSAIFSSSSSSSSSSSDST